MKQPLTKEIAYKALQKFFDNTPFVLFGTGISCAVDTRFGMNVLKDHLLREIPQKALNHDQQAQWNSVVTSLNNCTDLESAMNAVQDEGLIRHVIDTTSALMVSLDIEYNIKILSGQYFWPALLLFRRLVDNLSETGRTLHVATTNYDLLAEHAFEQAKIPYITGFVGGISRHLDWEQAKRSVTYYEEIPNRRKIKRVQKFKKHIRLYKVHGSLNIFRTDSNVVENNAWIHQVPDGIERVMITPGTSKYERLHQNRFELLNTHDTSVAKHNTFLFVGFGFNDNQLINDSIKGKLKDQKCQGLIITRDSNERIEALVNECDNLWLICKHHDNNNEGTRIFNRRYSNCLIIPDRKLWDSGQFTQEILGG